jgi:hypothetical protein
MTLIGFAAREDRADIITDTLTYTRVARYFSRTTKVLLLPHLDGALMTQGSTQFGYQWYIEALTNSARATSMDDFNAAAPQGLRDTWDRMQGHVRSQHEQYGATQTLAASVIFHVGWSDQAGGFTAHAYASDDEFEPVRVDGLHVMPSPLDRRPSDLELGRLRHHFDHYFDDTTVVDRLSRLPAGDVPDTPEEWAELARRVRKDRALVSLYSGLKTYVGGDVIHTRLRRGEVTQRRLLTFDDQGPEFVRMVAGSLHPQGQAGRCDCGSGRCLVDCCMAALAPQACPCGSGRTFGTCCSIRAA